VAYENEQALKLVTTYKYEKNGWNAEVTGFGNYIFNFIYLRPEGVTESIRGVFPTFRYTQTDALFLGVDASVERTLSPALSLEGKMSLLYASDVTHHDYLIFIPPNRYEITLRYEKEDVSQGPDFYAETGLRYVAKQHRAPRVIPVEVWIDALEKGEDPLSDDDSNFDFVPAPDGYVLLEMAVGVSLGRGAVHYDMRLSAENLLNTSYRDYTNRLRYYADDIGRNVSLSFKCIF
jgi:iron complex outermembrane recepter protein